MTIVFFQYPGPNTGGRPIYRDRFDIDERRGMEDEPTTFRGGATPVISNGAGRRGPLLARFQPQVVATSLVRYHSSPPVEPS